MYTTWAYVLISVSIISLISFVGALSLSVQREKLNKWLLYMVSFSAGALLGDVFLHILPEISQNGLSAKQSILILFGIVLFFILEKFVFWHHSHSEHSEKIHAYTYLSIISDSLHNFTDGAIVAASFLVNIKLGIATTLAVIFHEIPQEIGNFAVLIHGGWKAKKALLYNFLSALTAILGALIILIFSQKFSINIQWVLPIAAASFIYIAMADLIPELHKETKKHTSAIQIFWFVFGIAIMGLMLFLEKF